MAHKTWTLELTAVPNSSAQEAAQFAPRRRTHTVTLDHNYWTTKRVIQVDGQPLPPDALRSYAIYSQGSDDLFQLDGHTCHVFIRPSLTSYSYDFAVDGRSVATGKPLTPRPEAVRARPGVASGTPLWGWLFFLPLMLMVLLGLGAAMWVFQALNHEVPRSYVATIGIAITGFYAIIGVAGDRSLPTAARMRRAVWTCLLVGAGSFVLNLIFWFIFR